MKTWTFPEKRPAGDGPWVNEPDKAQWVDQATGLDALVVRGPMGALCGYVGVPPGHPWHGQGYGEIEVDVHGGLTYADFCMEGAEDGPGVCHVPEPGRAPNVWWLGFDCAHYCDLVPRIQDSPFPMSVTVVYRTFDYVRREIVHLAEQVAAKHTSEESNLEPAVLETAALPVELEA